MSGHKIPDSIVSESLQGGGGGGKDTIFLAESAIFYPYALHSVFGRAISWSASLILQPRKV